MQQCQEKSIYIRNINESMLDRRRMLMVGDSAIDLSFLDINGNYTFIRETANCYIVREPGKYKFPLVPGCAIKNSSKNPKSYQAGYKTGMGPFYFSDYPAFYTENNYSGSVIFCDVTGFTISNIYIKTGTDFYGNPKFYSQLYFQVNSIPQCGGNAIIALKNENGAILWSWHIWAYPFTLDYFHNDFLNVNVGFVKNSVNSIYGTSPYYQWGRKDPMLRSGATAVIGQFITSNSPAQNIIDGEANPTTLYSYAPSSSYNNWYIDPGGCNYWNTNMYSSSPLPTGLYIEKTVYDPCPTGLVVPSNENFIAFSALTKTWDNNGYIFTDGAKQSYFPALGRMQAGGSIIDGQCGYYWTGRASIPQSFYFFFRNGQVASASSQAKYLAAPIRPIRDYHLTGWGDASMPYALYTDKFNNLDGEGHADAIEDFNKYFGDFYQGEWEEDNNEAMRYAIDQAWSYDKCDCWELVDEQFNFNNGTYCLWQKSNNWDSSDKYFILTDSVAIIKAHFSDFMCNNSAKRYCPIHYILTEDYDVEYMSGDITRVKYGTWDDTYEGLAVYSLGWKYLGY